MHIFGEYLIQYFGAKKTAKYSQIMNIIISRSFIRKVAVTLFLNVILIVLSLFIPRIAMILYLVIPVTSFLFPVKRNKIVWLNYKPLYQMCIYN